MSLFSFRLSLPNIITSDLSRYTKSICRKISLETRAAYTPLLDSSNRSMFIRHTRTHGIQPYQSKCSLLLQQYIFEPIGYKPLVQFIAQFVRGVQIGKSGNRFDRRERGDLYGSQRAEYHGLAPRHIAHCPKIDNPGQPSRKNVVLVFMESMSAELLGHFGNPEHLTPFLDSIAVRSLCFNRFFSAGTHTNHAIHSVLYSYPALMKRNSMKGAVIPFFAGLPTIYKITDTVRFFHDS